MQQLQALTQEPDGEGETATPSAEVSLVYHR